jgi:Zn finger protein HypA/HybF involved in hydrogenase expression
MHEAAMIEEIIRNAGGAKMIYLEVGDLSGFSADHLKEHLADYGILGVCEEKPAVVDCSCGFSGRPKIREKLHDLVIFECPECGAVPRVVMGDKVIIKKVGGL